MPGQRLAGRALLDVPHDDLAIVARGDEGAAVRGEGGRRHRAVVAAGGVPHRPAAEVEEPHRAALVADGDACGRPG